MKVTATRIGRRRRHRRHKARFRMHSMRVGGRLYTGDYLETAMGRQAIREEHRIQYWEMPSSIARMSEEIQAVRRQLPASIFDLLGLKP